MTSKEYLRQAYRLDQRIASDLRELEELKQMSTSIASTDYNADRVQHSPANEAPFVRALMKIETLSEKINAEVDDLVTLKAEIHERIEKVPNLDEQMLLRYRYIHFDTWEDIAEAMHYSIRWTYIMHRNALRSFDATLEKEVQKQNTAH